MTGKGEERVKSRSSNPRKEMGKGGENRWRASGILMFEWSLRSPWTCQERDEQQRIDRLQDDELYLITTEYLKLQVPGGSR